MIHDDLCVLQARPRNLKMVLKGDIQGAETLAAIDLAHFRM